MQSSLLKFAFFNIFGYREEKNYEERIPNLLHKANFFL